MAGCLSQKKKVLNLWYKWQPKNYFDTIKRKFSGLLTNLLTFRWQYVSMFIFFLFLLFACFFFLALLLISALSLSKKSGKKNLAIITNHLESNILATFQVEKMAKSIFWFNQWSENKNYQYLTCCFYVLVALDYEFSLITGFPWLDIIPVRMPILQNQSSRCCSSHLITIHQCLFNMNFSHLTLSYASFLWSLK